MKTIKSSQSFLSEIEKLSGSGNAVSSGTVKVSNDGVDTLPTAKGYVSQTKEIKELMDLFRALILKDTEDLFEMYETIEILDDQIGKSLQG